MDLTDNPNTTAVDARRGSIYIRPTLNDPQLFIKQDDGSTTNWSKINKLDPQTLAFINADETDIASVSTGNNAVFDGGGTFQGTLSKSTTAADLISGANVFKWVGNATAGNNTNDYAAHSVIDIPQGSRGKYLVFLVKAKWDGGTDNMSFRVKDTTNANILSPVGTENLGAVTPADNEAAFYSFMYFVPSDCEQVECGFQCTNGESSRTLIWDDIIFTEDAFKAFELSSSQTYTANIANNGATASIIRQEPTFITTVNRTAVGRVTINFPAGLFVNPPVVVASGIDAAAIDHQVNVHSVTNTSCNVIFESSNLGTDFDADFGLIAVSQDPSQSSGVVVRAASFAPSMIRTGPASGHGAVNTHIRRFPTNVEAIGTAIEKVDDVNNGTYFEVKENGVYHMAYVDGATGNNIGFGITQDTTEFTTNIYDLVDKTTVLAMCRPQNASVNPYDTASATKYLTTGTRIYCHTDTFPNQDTHASFTITKIGTSQVVGVPAARVAYLKDVKPSGTVGGTFTSGSYQTRVLNTLEGDSEFVTLASNQFTLPKGEYILEAVCPGFLVSNHKARLQNITDALTVSLGSYAQTSAACLNHSFIYAKFQVLDQKTFEIQHRCSTTRASDGFGSAASFGDDEIFTQVKITKVG